MTQAISAPARRFGELRVVAPLCVAHFLSHYYMIMLAPLFAFVRADYGVSYTDLALALTAFGAALFFAMMAPGPQNAALQSITPNRMRGQATALFLFVYLLYALLKPEKF